MDYDYGLLLTWASGHSAHEISAMACLKDRASDRQASLMIIVMMMVRIFAACVHRETACSLEIKTRLEDNCTT